MDALSLELGLGLGLGLRVDRLGEDEGLRALNVPLGLGWPYSGAFFVAEGLGAILSSGAKLVAGWDDGVPEIVADVMG